MSAEPGSLWLQLVNRNPEGCEPHSVMCPVYKVLRWEDEEAIKHVLTCAWLLNELTASKAKEGQVSQCVTQGTGARTFFPNNKYALWDVSYAL